MSDYLPGPPSDAPVAISRDVLRVLAMADISPAGRRVLDMLMVLSDPDTGAATVSQNEMCKLLSASKPTVNRGFKELREWGLAWALDDGSGRYQLHPLLTDGKVAAAVIAVPEIATDPDVLTERRKARYAPQIATLARRHLDAAG